MTDETTDILGAPGPNDELEALAALTCNDDAREVDDPDPETLTGEIPPLSDEPEEDELQPDGGAETTPEAETSQDKPSSDDTSTIDVLELAALATGAGSPDQTMPFAPVVPPSAPQPAATERISGAAKGTGSLAWGSRTDVGCLREHNEDSFVVRFPLFAVADGMGGHAAGEVASTIAVSSLADHAPSTPDDTALAQAVEQANLDVIDGATSGLGRAGMGTTCTAAVIDGHTMAIAHVGDSRCYLLHAGQLVRVTHDHSYVEELVAAGKITREEARIHPNRSVITRALGSDRAMQADHFTVEVARGDRVLLCSDGLSSMVTDDAIEETMVSTTTPQTCADALVDLALAMGGHDNVTCIVVDVKDDGIASRAFKARLRNVLAGTLVGLAVLLLAFLGLYGISQRSWYLADNDGYVALYRGISGMPSELGMSSLIESSEIRTDLLSESVGQRLSAGISFSSEEDARNTLSSYREQVSSATQNTAHAPESTASKAASKSGSRTDTQGEA